MKKIKRILSCMLIICLIFSFAACGKKDAYETIEIKQQTLQTQQEQTHTHQVLSIGITEDVGSLHPLFVSSTQMASINHLIYEGLFELDAAGRAQHCLAMDYSYQQQEDGTVIWKLELSQNVPWHGSLGMLTAQDAVYTIETILNYGGFYASNAAGIVSVSAEDSANLTIVTDRYYPDMPEKLSFPIIPQNYYSGKEDQQVTPMGCGAYFVEKMDAADDTWLVLRAFEDRWRQSAQIDQIQVFVYHDSSALIKAYQQGEIQVALTNEVITGQALGAGKGNVYPVWSNTLEILIPNTSLAPLDDVLVRQAIGYAINKNDIMTLLYAKRAGDVDLPIATGHFVESAQSHRYDYDVQQARALLAQAGYRDGDGDGFLDAKQGGGPLTLRLVTNDVENNTLRRQTANLIGESLAQVGICVEVEVVGFSDVSDILASGNYDLVLTGITTPVLPQTGFLYNQALNGYKSPAIDEALQAIDEAKDREAWLDANEHAQQILLDEYSVMPLFYRCHVLIADKTIEGVEPCGALDALHNMDQWQAFALPQT